jgi:hypothetical protein
MTFTMSRQPHINNYKIPNIERVEKLLIAQSIYAESDLQSVTLSILGIL